MRKIVKSVAGDRAQTVQFALADFDKSRLLCKDARYDATQRVLRGLAVSFGRYRTLLINIHIERVPATLITRDQVWDMRTKACIHTLTGHTNTVADVVTQTANPQVVTGSHDSIVRLWDLAGGKTKAVLTNHKN